MSAQDRQKGQERAPKPARRGLRSAEPTAHEGEPIQLISLSGGCFSPSAGDVLDEERQRLEEALRRREQEISVIADNVPALFSYVDADGRYRFVNKRYEEWFGVPRTEIIGRHYREVLGEAAYERIRDHVERVLRGRQVRYEDSLPYRNGGTRWVSADYVPDTDDRGKVKGFFALVTDITGWKRAEEAVRERETRLRTLFEESLNPILVVDEQGRYVDANKAALDFLECSREELLAKRVWEFSPPGLLEQQKREHSPFVGRRTLETDYFVHGRIKTLLLNVVPLTEAGKSILYGIGQDITERKRAEEALQEAREELESRVERRMRRGSAYGLTFRELTVLHLVVAGKSDKEIGAVLGISTLTASKHLANILHKMGAASRTEAGVRAVREGLLD